MTPLIEKQIQIKAEKNNVPIEEAARILIEEKQPSGACSYPEDLGALATFLCSNSARQINGATYTMDGGWTAQWCEFVEYFKIQYQFLTHSFPEKYSNS